MRFWRAALPNLSIALNIALLIVIYLDRRNPMMGFLVGAPFTVLAACACICSIATAAVLYGGWRNRGKSRKNTEIPDLKK
ncbi:MAG: hypothetical protein IJ375_00120 [Oscillospiraceae bacterium]|nr:hypothetical protein [Oscillospiraceae bacterium]